MTLKVSTATGAAIGCSASSLATAGFLVLKAIHVVVFQNYCGLPTTMYVG